MEEKNEKQELDLIILLQKIVDFIILIIKKIVGSFGYLLQLTYKYRYVFLLFIVAAIAFAIYKTTGDRKIYKSEFIFELNDGDSFLYSEIVNNLNQYLDDRDYTGLAQILNTPVDNTKKISFLKPYFMIDLNNDSIIDLIDYESEYNPSDTLNTRASNRIVISAGVKNTAFSPELKDLLMNYFNRNKYLVSINESRLNQLREKEIFYEQNIREIDSLQRIEYFEKKNSPEVRMEQSQNGVLMNTNKQMFYKDKIKILKEKEIISKELASNADIIKVIMESQPTSKSIYSFSKTALKYVGIAVGLFFILILLFDFRGNIMAYLRNE
jgi:hypothetical protein